VLEFDVHAHPELLDIEWRRIPVHAYPRTCIAGFVEGEM
jgi:hypothetical protein